ncbi:small ribosomal subunit protein mS31 [Antennarius striatus]|uniref:small ribosomal subunit protein mS31 n=1 Tax=Antennarius striatus TaxID=241820 RepID=UPI0035B0820B
MHRYLCRTVYATRNSPVSILESCLSLAKCGKAETLAYSFETEGVRTLSTSSVKSCENKNDVSSSNRDDKPAANRDVDATETPTLTVQATENDNNIVNIVVQSEEPAVLKTNDGNATQQHIDVKIKPATATEEIKTTVNKGGKENLHDLLRSLKVDITTKATDRLLKRNESLKSTFGLKPEAVESSTSMSQQSTKGPSTESLSTVFLSEGLNPELLAAASAAAATLPNQSQVEIDLIKQLRQQETQKKGDIDVRSIISGMKVRQNSKQTRPHDDDSTRGSTSMRGSFAASLEGTWKRRTMLSNKRLQIFSPRSEEGIVSTVARPTLWDLEFAEELSLSVNHMPSNKLEEMIQWTKEGKLWEYPINNEAGLDEEASVSFNEHVFLEKHLEEGFPLQGPVRHFMELVVAGLSKNPYLTVQNKKEHISWYRDYFQQKKETLEE